MCSQNIFYFSEVFCKDKTVLGKGDILKMPKLAETMETIAEQGAEAFYSGKIGQDLIQDIQAAGWCSLNICCLGCKHWNSKGKVQKYG